MTQLPTVDDYLDYHLVAHRMGATVPQFIIDIANERGVEPGTPTGQRCCDCDSTQTHRPVLPLLHTGKVIEHAAR
jgi:hypothetical protein